MNSCCKSNVHNIKSGVTFRAIYALYFNIQLVNKLHVDLPEITALTPSRKKYEHPSCIDV